MPSVNIRQLRNTRKLKAWLRAGKTVELRERDKVIARIVPAEETGKSRRPRYSLTTDKGQRLTDSSANPAQLRGAVDRRFLHTLMWQA
jgi:antitoxin (DNA-binding transcriptional repressor) of toxin-antitoxin stability system